MMNRGTGFIKLTLAGDLPARVSLPPAAGYPSRSRTRCARNTCSIRA
jgi:hypothetical protein